MENDFHITETLAPGKKGDCGLVYFLHYQITEIGQHCFVKLWTKIPPLSYILWVFTNEW